MFIPKEYPKKIQELQQHIYNLMDYFGGTSEEVENLRQMVIAQNIIINELLKAQYLGKVSTKHSGFWSPIQKLKEWIRTAINK
jgi:hypothetical protein